MGLAVRGGVEEGHETDKCNAMDQSPLHSSADFTQTLMYIHYL